MTDKEKREIQGIIDEGLLRFSQTITANFDSQIGELLKHVDKRIKALENAKTNPDKLLSTADACAHFQITRSTLNRYVKHGGLTQQKKPGEKRGRAYYKLSDINNFLKPKG